MRYHDTFLLLQNATYRMLKCWGHRFIAGGAKERKKRYADL